MMRRFCLIARINKDGSLVNDNDAPLHWRVVRDLDDEAARALVSDVSGASRPNRIALLTACALFVAQRRLRIPLT